MEPFKRKLKPLTLANRALLALFFLSIISFCASLFFQHQSDTNTERYLEHQKNMITLASTLKEKPGADENKPMPDQLTPEMLTKLQTEIMFSQSDIMSYMKHRHPKCFSANYLSGSTTPKDVFLNARRWENCSYLQIHRGTIEAVAWYTTLVTFIFIAGVLFFKLLKSTDAYILAFFTLLTLAFTSIFGRSKDKPDVKIASGNKNKEQR